MVPDLLFGPLPRKPAHFFFPACMSLPVVTDTIGLLECSLLPARKELPRLDLT
jgi:hypothetical protein